MLSILTFAVLLTALACSSAQVDPPSILNIEIRGQGVVFIAWQTTPKTSPSRFRVSIMSSSDTTSTAEWPAQFRRVSYDSLDTPYKQLETQSNYECFNLCIQDPDCAFVVRSSSPKGNNCFFKKDASKVTSANLDPDSEYGLIDTYSNSSLVRYLSSNDAYTARISVYDSVVKQWSAFSGPVNFLLSNRFSLTFTRTGVTSGSLSWEMAGLNDYSRFGLLVSANQSNYTQLTDIDMSTLETFEHSKGYFSIEDYSKFIVTPSKQACIDSCFSKFDCVQLVYFSEDFKAQDGTKIASKNSCYLNKKLKMANGIFRKSNTTVLHVKDTRSRIDLPKADFGAWRFKLETWTPYGVNEVSPSIAYYNMTSASPVLGRASVSKYMNITWQMPEPLGLKRAAFYYTINGSTEYTYVIKASSDFIDPDQILIETDKFNECFEACYKSQTCLAYSFAALERKCFLKTKTNQPNPCPVGLTCGIIPETVQFDYSIYAYVNTEYCFYAYATTSFDYTTPAGRLICTRTLGSVTIDKYGPFLAGYRARLRCYVHDYNGKINWYKDFRPLNTTGLSIEFSADKTIAFFENITSRLHNGVYTCENELDNGQLFYSSDRVSVEVIEAKPSNPYVTRATFIGLNSEKKRSMLIQFTYDPFSLPTECIILYYSADVVDFKNKTYCSSSLAGGSIVIDDPFNCSYTFFLKAINSVGSSSPSPTFNIANTECKGQDPTEYEYRQTYFASFIVSICAAGVLLIVVAVLIYTRISSKKHVNP